ncbi:uncharacterized protein HKW66_Vig0237110 [Vigna angularis]|uniref:Uncharacterized protein n=1 Tax=Phaseolus angularis TaxID=3914 RepID=A0A8T0KS30_PHAAN|nr:uncharacterized protein HKW66_Vig0237110 [Vigna angularis]
MEMLETQFGIRCTNSVELGPLAADVLGMPHLRTCGVDKLALEVLGFDLGRRLLRGRKYENEPKIENKEFLHLPPKAMSGCTSFPIALVCDDYYSFKSVQWEKPCMTERVAEIAGRTQGS